ncbi:hypothetical protein ACFUJR_31325, partial [Streptomyces sp. NPDC057271]|uniref:hypothetical protein n=1 Tax=unclassified Streptomyces TaxID=2593676 RepID=UPI00362CA518
WHAVEFSRNGRFLCTHPLGLSSGLPFGLSCFQPYQILFRSVSGSDFLSGGLLAALPFGVVTTLAEFPGDS